MEVYRMKAFDIVVCVFALIGFLSTFIAIGGLVLFLIFEKNCKNEQQKTEKEFADMFDIDLRHFKVEKNADKEKDFSRMFKPFGEKEEDK